MYLVAKSGTYKFNIRSKVGDDIDYVLVDVKNVTGQFELGHDLELAKVYYIVNGKVDYDRVAVKNKGTANALNIDEAVEVLLGEPSYCDGISKLELQSRILVI